MNGDTFNSDLDLGKAMYKNKHLSRAFLWHSRLEFRLIPGIGGPANEMRWLDKRDEDT